MKLPIFKTKEELYDYLIENKDDIIYRKKSVTKYENSLGGHTVLIESTPETHYENGSFKFLAYKAIPEDNATELEVRAIINTTNYIDSHDDVHIKGLWNRSIKNNKNIIMLQEHEMKFDKVIASKEDLDVSTKEMDWRKLGLDVEGKTEALVFDANVKESKNAYMFGLYKNGEVTNHSVGMRYVQIKLAINSDRESEINEKEVWDLHYPDIANKEQADKLGHFWAVLEAKVIEGSAVVLGSNDITPTLTRSKDHLVEEEQKRLDNLSPEQKFINNLKI